MSTNNKPVGFLLGAPSIHWCKMTTKAVTIIFLKESISRECQKEG